MIRAWVIVAVLAGCGSAEAPDAQAPAVVRGRKPAEIRLRRARAVRIPLRGEPDALREALTPILRERVPDATAWRDLGCADATWWDTDTGHLAARGYRLTYEATHRCGTDTLSGYELSLAFTGADASAAQRALLAGEGARYTVHAHEVDTKTTGGSAITQTVAAVRRGKAGRVTIDPTPAGSTIAMTFPTLPDLIATAPVEQTCVRAAAVHRWRWADADDAHLAPVLETWRDAAGGSAGGATLILRSGPADDEVFDALGTVLASTLGGLGLLADADADPGTWATTCP